MAAVVRVGWWWMHLSDVTSGRHALRAASADTGLLTVFALHHSLLARPAAKRWVTKWVPADLVRSAYVWVASLLLMAVTWLWVPIGVDVYRASGAMHVLLLSAQVVGIALSILCVRKISVSELAGLAEPKPTDVLQHDGPYRFVRHPLYSGWVLIFFGTPLMTGDRLLFATVTTAYLLIAMPFEEAGLTSQFGNRYLEYRRVVRWRLIPYIH